MYKPLAFLIALCPAVATGERVGAPKVPEPLAAAVSADAQARMELRLAALERARIAHEEATRKLLEMSRQLEQRLQELETVREAGGSGSGALATRNAGAPESSPAPDDRLAHGRRLERRVTELEMSQAASRDATREIIRDSVSTLGARINESVELHGSVEVAAGVRQDFGGKVESTLEVATAEVGLDVSVNSWTRAELLLEYDAGSRTFADTDGEETAVDRINLKVASITLGDTGRFPLYAFAGRQTLPFGVSYGSPVAEPLSLDDPLTVEVFETEEVALGIGVAFPTRPLRPEAPGVAPPPVRPMLFAPAVHAIGHALGYRAPPQRALPPEIVTPQALPPMFHAAIYTYDGDTRISGGRGFDVDGHFGATAGINLQGNCGRRYEAIAAEANSWLFSTGCPWAVDVDVDYNNSVFDSLFLEEGYRPFLASIGYVGGVAASIKAAIGAMAIVAEWNGAIEDASFVDGVNRFIRMRPRTWSIGLGVQLGWNPWVQRIAEQGTYLMLGYSESRDLAGVIRPGAGERIGNVPRRRFSIGVGEWLMDGVRFELEYSRGYDYPVSEGGTGRHADAIVSQFSYIW